jgi:outer membrane protein
MFSMNILLAAGLAAAADAAAGTAAQSHGAPALTLAQAEKYALHGQPSVQQAAGQTEAARGRVEEARSGYLPQANAFATWYIARHGFNGLGVGGVPVASGTGNGTGNGNGGTGTGGTTSGAGTSYNSWGTGVTATQLIYDFNTTLDRWRSADASRDAAQANERTTAQQVLLNLRRAYFTARGQRDQVRVNEEALANQQRHLDQIENLVKAGIRSQIDLATQRTAVANARVQAVTAENNYEADLALLNQTMGLPSGTSFELTDTEMPPVPGEDGDERQMIEAALKARPEVANADQQVRAQELTVGADRGTYFPAIGAVGNVTEFGQGTTVGSPAWYVGLQANWALLQGGLTHGQVREAKGTLQALSAQAAAVRLQVTVDVVQGRLAVRAAKATISSAEEALANAREQLRLAEARYQTGQGSIIELFDAQVAYTTAEAQEVTAKYSLASARAQLLAALGETR